MPLDERRASGASYTLKSVCGECNHGWMSQLETRFGALLPRMEVDMSPKRFTKEERATIAKWIIKTGIVAHLSSNYRRILPSDFPQWMSQGQVIPAGVKVFGGRFEPGQKVLWAQSNFSSLTLRKEEGESLNAYQQTFVFALAIKGIFIGFGWHGLDRRNYTIALPVGDTHHLYPHPRSATIKSVYDDIRKPAMLIRLESR